MTAMMPYNHASINMQLSTHTHTHVKFDVCYNLKGKEAKESILSLNNSTSCSDLHFCEHTATLVPTGARTAPPLGAYDFCLRVGWGGGGERQLLSSQGDPQEGDGKSDQSWLNTSVLGNPIR